MNNSKERSAWLFSGYYVSPSNTRKKIKSRRKATVYCPDHQDFSHLAHPLVIYISKWQLVRPSYHSSAVALRDVFGYSWKAWELLDMYPRLSPRKSFEHHGSAPQTGCVPTAALGSVSTDGLPLIPLNPLHQGRYHWLKQRTRVTKGTFWCFRCLIWRGRAARLSWRSPSLAADKGIKSDGYRTQWLAWTGPRATWSDQREMKWLLLNFYPTLWRKEKRK